MLSNQGSILKWLIVSHSYLEVIQCPKSEGLWGCATTHHRTYFILHICCLSTRLISEQLFCVQSLFANLYKSCREIKVSWKSNKLISGGSNKCTGSSKRCVYFHQGHAMELFSKQKFMMCCYASLQTWAGILPWEEVKEGKKMISAIIQSHMPHLPHKLNNKCFFLINKKSLRSNGRMQDAGWDMMQNSVHWRAIC